MTWHIEVIAGLDRGKKATLKIDLLSLVRDQVLCNLVLSDESVSRVHAKVTVDASGTIFIEDMGSTHGTFISGSVLMPVPSWSGFQDTFWKPIQHESAAPPVKNIEN